MNVLVTGGAGFIGSHLVDRLVNDGFNVHVADNLSTGSLANLSRCASKIRFQEIDIQSSKMREYISQIQPSYIFHFAAHVSVPDSIENPKKDFDTNVKGLQNLLKILKNYPPQVLIFSSSAAIYAEHNSLIDETYPCEPLNPYGINKLWGEQSIRFYARHFGFRAICLRYANVYGIRQTFSKETGVIRKFKEQMKLDQVCQIYGDGSQARDFIHVDDITNANILALKSQEKFAIINISTAIPTSINVLFELMSRKMGYKKNAQYNSAQQDAPYFSCLNNGLAKQTLNWSPTVSLEAGIEGLCKN